MNRVFHIIGIVWVLISLLVLPQGWLAAPLFVFGITCFILLFAFRQRRLPLWIFSAVAAVCLCSCTLIIHSIGTDPKQYINTEQTIQGVVTDQIFKEKSVETHLRLTENNPVGLRNKRILIRSRSGVEESTGDVVEYKIKLQANHPTNLWAKGFNFEGFGTDAKIIGTEKTIEVKLSELRQTMSGRFLRLLPKEEGGFLSAVLLGRTEKISGALRRIYSQAGISHLLAVSGLHLTILLSLFSILLKNRWISRNMRLLLEIFVAILFTALTGFPPSMLRAASMLIICRLALLLGRDSDALNSLGFSIVLILLINPYAVYSISLQLSYLSTMGICAFEEHLTGTLGKILFHKDYYEIKETNPKLSNLLSMICVTLSAQILSMPLVCWIFGIFSLISPITNILVTLPATLMLLFGIICAILGFFPILMPLCRLSALIAGLCARLITFIAKLCASIPFASFPLEDDCIIIWLATSTLFLILIWYLHCTKIYIFWTCEWIACTLIIALCMRPIFWGFPITIAVSNFGESVLLFHGNQAALIGVPGKRSEAENIIYLMEDFNVKSLQLLIPEKSEDLNSAATKYLIRTYPPENIVPLDKYNSINADLFGNVKLIQEDKALRILSSNYSIVKDFKMTSTPAHILINGKNEIIVMPELKLSQNSRYYGSTMIFLPDNRNLGG